MTTIFGLSGSLREGSFNASLLRAAASVAPVGAEVKIGTIRGVPLYDADVENGEGVPESVLRLRDEIDAADGLLLVTPEYNNGIPGVFKNAIDWIGSGPGARVFAGKPVAVMGASPGGFGTILCQDAWLPVLRALKARQWHGGRLMLSQARKAFDADGVLVDDAARQKLSDFVAGFVEEVRRG
ncbi:NAD(P)H-dependent FMN reductase [Aliiruegeria haliotis]|uniref:NAD(P)H-dependent FMN reductase n=1 Tax=Aliiruegeria haliotis TaxID=1280846 RepID=A0A2T0RQT4_9RHOB|nr:NADPH-dependent FMN reductase [Aliiruegeria haliotis]PRY23556.1 NAD(P)H-dependent FMN reductase [Aliiruegeria haliotis]